MASQSQDEGQEVDAQIYIEEGEDDDAEKQDSEEGNQQLEEEQPEFDA